MRLEPQEPRRVREHRPRVRLGEALAVEAAQEDLGVAAGHVGVALALGRRVAEVAPAVDHLLGRAAADPELQAAAGDEVGGAGVLGHVERVLVAHVDDGGADLDAAGARADRGEEREGRGELAGEMVDADIGAVGAELLGGDREVDRLEERVLRRARARALRRRPVAEGEKSDLLHGAASAIRPGRARLPTYRHRWRFQAPSGAAVASGTMRRSRHGRALPKMCTTLLPLWSGGPLIRYTARKC